ncbi:MAG: flagellar protein FlaG [Planctomycetes bacterium]|nr:flagellar protein FlaG [Planctomycetota bacterium]
MTRIDASLATQVGDTVRPYQASQDQQLQVQQARRTDLAQPAEKTASSDDIRAAAAQLKQVVEAASGRQLSFTFDDTSKELVVKVTDTRTGKLVRQIPSQEVLDLQDRIDSLVGVIFNHNA